MHILIVGANGQLGRAAQQVFGQTSVAKISCWSHADVDIADPATVERVAEAGPDVVINGAAWTNVDGAEMDPDGAYAVNALGPHYLATGCNRCGAMFVHISTNEVFAGKQGCFYREYDQPEPGGVYARSKRAGEIAALAACPRTYVIRVAWLFGPGGEHFPKKIVAAAEKFGALKVVDDEFGNPTYAPDVAQALVRLVETRMFGIYHLVNGGQASRFEFAKSVLGATGRGEIPLTPIPSSEWPRAVTPPQHSILVNQAGAGLGIKLRSWDEALLEYVKTHSGDFGTLPVQVEQQKVVSNHE